MKGDMFRVMLNSALSSMIVWIRIDLLVEHQVTVDMHCDAGVCAVIIWEIESRGWVTKPLEVFGGLS